MPNYSAIEDNKEAEPETSQQTATTQLTAEPIDTVIDDQPKERNVFVSFFVYLMKQSYAGALIMMMVKTFYIFQEQNIKFYKVK